MLIKVDVPSKVWVLTQSTLVLWVQIPLETRMCSHISVLRCVVRGLATSWSPAQAVLPNVKPIQKFRHSECDRALGEIIRSLTSRFTCVCSETPAQTPLKLQRSVVVVQNTRKRYVSFTLNLTNNCSWWQNYLAVRYNTNNFRLWRQFAQINHNYLLFRCSSFEMYLMPPITVCTIEHIKVDLSCPFT
jgi:hypothetical protein